MSVVAYKALDASKMIRRPIRRARTSSGMERPRQKVRNRYGLSRDSKQENGLYPPKAKAELV
jgi:hypothetical protein